MSDTLAMLRLDRLSDRERQTLGQVRTSKQHGDDAPMRDALLEELSAAANPERALGQRAYMKSAMSFYGVTVPEVRRIVSTLVRERPFMDADAWQATLLDIWRRAAQREERYAAVEILNHARYRRWLTPSAFPTIEELVVTGAWWDFVDAIASRAVGTALTNHPAEVGALLRTWSVDPSIWKRRTAILAQLKRGRNTDPVLLFDLIEPSIGESEFFLRKAIGWALRSYSKVEPDAVVAYVAANAERLSPLTKREGLRTLLKSGVVEGLP